MAGTAHHLRRWRIIRPIIGTCDWCQQLHCNCPPRVPGCIIVDLEAVSEAVQAGQLEVADLWMRLGNAAP